MKLKTCWDFYRFRASLGARGLVGGIYYERCFEYPWCFNELALRPGDTLLDVGTERSPFPFFCAVYVPNTTVHAADKDLHPFTQTQRNYLRHVRSRLKQVGSRMSLSIQDAVSLPYPDATFDRISCISVIEHLPGDGDIRVMRELSRVLKPGGCIVLTTDMAIHYQERYRNSRSAAEPVFYAKEYSEEALYLRLIEPSGLHLGKLVFVYEPGIRYSRLTTNPKLKTLLLPFRILNPWLAQRWLIPDHRLNEAPSPNKRRLVCMMLRKNLAKADYTQHQKPRNGAY